MIKKMVIAVLLIPALSAAVFSGTRNFSVLSETMTEHLPDITKPLYEKNRLYFHLGHLLAKTFTSTASATNASQYFPSDRIAIKLTADRMENFPVEAILLDFGQTSDPLLFRDLIHDNGHITLDTAVPDFSNYKTVAVQAVLTNSLTALPDEALVNIDIKDPLLIDPNHMQFSIRMIKLLEKMDDPFDSSGYDLPLVTVNTKMSMPGA